MNEEKQKPYHYFMILGEVVFRIRDQEEINSVRQNGVLTSDSTTLPVRMIGKAQQVIQLGFHQRMQDPNIEVLDVVLYSFTYLGEMTQDEFHAAPEGSKLQERNSASVTPVDVPELEQLVASAETPVADTSTQQDE